MDERPAGQVPWRVGPATRRPPVRVDPELLAQARRRVVAGGQGAAAVEQVVRDLGGVLGREDRAALTGAVRAEVQGAGPLQALVDEPDVSDVLVNGPGQVWVDRGHGLEQVDLDLGSDADVRRLAVRLAAAGGRRLDDASPVVDARLPDGTRVHAVLPPVSGSGVLISLRVLRRRAFRLGELVRAGSVAPGVAEVLSTLVAGRANVLVSGATGTGKTTMLSSLLSLVAPDERVVCIEDAGELAPDHPHVVRLVTRPPNVEGAGEMDLAALVRHALRMRPDRLVLGECRGAEVREVLSALNTGHSGGWATIHANTAQDVPARLEALAATAGMGREALAAQAASALDAVVHLRRDGGLRHVSQVGVVTRDPAGRLVVLPALTQGVRGDVRREEGWSMLAPRSVGTGPGVSGVV